jgi:hypothetical protein
LKKYQYLREVGMATVDINTGPPITGKFSAIVVDASGVPPSDVVRVSDPFSIDCSWYLEGGLASSIGGKWYVQAAFESVGPGAEFRSAELTLNLDGRTGSANPYTAQLNFPTGANFPSGQPKVPAGDRNATYEVAVLLSYTDVAGNPGPLSASVNLERLTIYA